MGIGSLMTQEVVTTLVALSWQIFGCWFWNNSMVLVPEMVLLTQIKREASWREMEVEVLCLQ